ncbi:MAG TPA: DUF2950 domain-containing protein [Bryobacteraceae bacterium]|nr:DUF2950 domain-containing protein [Bryobacteraceae bacterium]
MKIAATSLIFCWAGLSLWAQPAAPGATSFDSPQAAVQALIDAAEKNDAARMAELFGPNSKALLSAGDPTKDKAEREEFCSLIRRKHQLQPSTLNSHVVILTVGEEDWPFPVPLIQTNGKWKFDTEEGRVEMRARKIGANELDAIEISAGYVEAQQNYSSRVRDEHGLLEYAQQIKSSSGKRDGLYWPGSDSLVPEGFADAESAGGAAAKPKEYHGYYFRVLKSQGPDAPGGQHNYLTKDSMIGGFGLVAWPAEYGVTGIHTFIVNQDGVVYERDMGAPTSNLTTSVATYNPDKNWMPVH